MNAFDLSPVQIRNWLILRARLAALAARLEPQLLAGQRRDLAALRPEEPRQEQVGPVNPAAS